MLLVSFFRYPFFNQSHDFSPLISTVAFLKSPCNVFFFALSHDLFSSSLLVVFLFQVVPYSENPLTVFLDFASSVFSNYESPLTRNLLHQSVFLLSSIFSCKACSRQPWFDLLHFLPKCSDIYMQYLLQGFSPCSHDSFCS